MFQNISIFEFLFKMFLSTKSLVEWASFVQTVMSTYSRIDLWFRVDVVQPRLKEDSNGFSWSKRHFFWFLVIFGQTWLVQDLTAVQLDSKVVQKWPKSGQLWFVTCHNQLRTCSKWIIIMVMWYVRPRMTNWITPGVRLHGDERECLGIKSKMIF